jgi:hypothetical protein
MIILRHTQLDNINKPKLLTFITIMITHTRESFPNETKAISDSELKKHIIKSIKKAENYNLTSQQDCCKFINLAVVYGWDFDQEPNNEWMIDILEDEEISSPSERLNRLLDECVYRKEVEEKNNKLWDDFFANTTGNNLITDNSSEIKTLEQTL